MIIHIIYNMETVDIVELVERNPITRLSNTYNNKLLNKIKENFTEEHQKIFLTSFYCYLNYNDNDFVVDLDDIWIWMDFSQKVTAKRLLEKNFKINEDYKISYHIEKKEGRGGHNKETILLSLNAFKEFCNSADTLKAKEIRKYYIKLEKLLHQTIEEECTELKNQLFIKEQEMKKEFELKQKKLKKEFQLKEEQMKEEIELKKEEMKKKDEEIEKLREEKGKLPMIYVYNLDTNKKGEESQLKIGITQSINERTKTYITSHPHGKLVSTHKVDGDEKNLRLFESFIHSKLKHFKVRGEVFNIDEEEVKYMINTDFELYNLYSNLNHKERKNIIIDIYESVVNRIHNIDIKVKRNIEKEQQKEYETREDSEPEEKNENADKKDIDVEQNIKKFIDEHCILHDDAEISSKMIVGHFRLVYRNKQKLITNKFTNYLRTNFLQTRLIAQDSTGVVNGFKGITLKPIIYEKQSENSFEQNFAWERCIFTPDGTTSFNDLLHEYQLFKISNYEEYDEHEDRKNLKKYFDSLKYVMYDTIHDSTNNCSSQGYYGITLKKYEKVAKISSTSKKVCKRNENGAIICVYDSVAKTAETEKVCTARIVRSIKNKVFYENQAGEKYYFTYYQVLPSCNSAAENTNVL